MSASTIALLVAVALFAQAGLWVAWSMTRPARAAGAVVAWTGYRPLRVVSKRFEDEARTVCTIELGAPDGAPLPGFEAGQFLTLRLATPGGAIVRCYSLSSLPGAPTWKVSVKRALPPGDVPDAPPGRGSRYLLDQLAEGDLLPCRPPAGSFTLAPGDTPLALVAAGVGITPVLSMLRHTLATRPERPVTLVYGVRDGSEHAFRDELRALAAAHPSFRLHTRYSRPRPQDRLGEDYDAAGRVSLDAVRAVLPDHRAVFHLCGPPGLIADLVPALTAWGVPESDLRLEAFGPSSAAGEAAAAESVGVHVTFAKSGKTVDFPVEARCLLDVAEANGVEVDTGCRGGECGSCEVAVLSGEVTYGKKPGYQPEAGRCLVCVGRPVGDVVLDA